MPRKTKRKTLNQSVIGPYGCYLLLSGSSTLKYDRHAQFLRVHLLRFKLRKSVLQKFLSQVFIRMSKNNLRDKKERMVNFPDFTLVPSLKSHGKFCNLLFKSVQDAWYEVVTKCIQQLRNIWRQKGQKCKKQLKDVDCFLQKTMMLKRCF